MVRRGFEVRDLVEIYLHWQAKESLRGIARNLGLDRNTVKKYIRAAEAAGFRTGQPRSEADWREFIQATFPEVADPLLRHQVFAEIGRFHDRIKAELSVNTASTVWQRLRDEAQLQASLTSFRRYVRAMLPEVVLAENLTVWRPEVAPGEEAQVDFSYLGKWLDPVTHLLRKVWAFAMVLAYSRHLFVRPVFRMDLRTWVECHLLAFEFFNGVPRRIVLDNLKSGVLKPSIYDPAFNRDYAQLAAHYGTLVDPCRAGHPKDKPRVERQFTYVKDSFWRGREFASLAHLQEEALHWCLTVAGLRIHGTTRQRPLEHFQNEEQACLGPLPRERWEPATWHTAKVGLDCHAAVAGSFYSVPFLYAGKPLTVRTTDQTVQFYAGEELVKTHVRAARGRRQTDLADLPAEKAAFYARNPAWCLAQAAALGPAVATVVHELLAVNTWYRLRQAQQLIRLAERYGALRVNAAAARALDYGDPSYLTVKNILEKGLEQLPSSAATDARPLPAFLHGDQAFDRKE